MSQRHHICVCICTYKRPELLRRLLSKLEEQKTEGLFDYSIVIVDNDSSESARQTAESCARQSKISIRYYVEPEQNIALARNRAIENAQGDFIAMIDDDEVPVNEWIYLLYVTLLSYKTDGALGPVRPAFPPEAPQWLINSGLCERRSYKTGTVLADTQTRTGNVLFHRRVFNNGKNLFEEQFGRTGGEDIDFFDKRIEEGFTFVWCEEASVYENVIPERFSLLFHLKKSIRMGGLTGEMMRKGTVPLWSNFFKSVCVTIFYTFLITVFAFCGKHILTRHLAKYVYHISRLLGTFGIVAIRER